MEAQWQAIWGSNPIQEESFKRKMLEIFQSVAGGLDPALKTALLKTRSGVGAMANSDTQEALSPPPYHLIQIKPPEGHGTQCLGNPMFADMRNEAVQKRCVPTPR